MASVTSVTTKTGGRRWRVRYRSPDGRSREKRFDRKADAERFARNTETDMDRGEWVDPRGGRITIAEWLSQHEAAKAYRRPATIARVQSLLSRHILPHWGDRQLRSIKPTEVRSWVMELSAEGLAADTVRKIVQLFASGMEAAVEDGVIPRSPARGVQLPKAERHEMRFLDVDETYRLAEAIDPQYRALVLAGAYTGCRFGELAAWRVGRLDSLRRKVTISEALTDVKGQVRFGAPKTKAARRTITLPQTLVDELAAHLAAYPAGDDGLVFTAPEGGPIRLTNWRRRTWYPAVDASVGRPMRVHDLRHTHAALLIAQGAHPKVIQARLGHTSIRTTLDTYGHLFPGLDEHVADALDEASTHRRVGCQVSVPVRHLGSGTYTTPRDISVPVPA